MGTRTGLVLGSGGFLGLAWMVGALRAIEEERQLEVGAFDLVVGTSSGSLLAVLLAAGATTRQLIAHQYGETVDDGPLAGVEISRETLIDTRIRPPRPGVGSGQLLLSYVRRRRRVYPSTFFAGLVPAGRGSLDGITNLVEAVAPTWPEGSDVEIVAMDYDTGERVVLGSPSRGLPPLAEHVEASPSTAVTASCAIPGWFAPVILDGRRYVDGGSVSVASADLLADRGIEEAFVLAPMASAPRDRTPPAWIVRWWRQHQIQQTQREVDRLRAEGVRVTYLTPTADDLAAAGLNLMDPVRSIQVLESSLRTSRETVRAYHQSPRPTPEPSSAGGQEGTHAGLPGGDAV